MQGFTESVRCELLHERSNVYISMVQLPALNTPQFHWVKTNFARHPQPVPPIYQPELAAEAIVWAASHHRREVTVGETTAATVLVDKIVPGLFDRYLGRTGFDSQQADWPVEAGRPDNLWEPVAGDHGARGEFDHRAHERSPQWWLTSHRGWALLGAGVLALVGTLRQGK
jgi:hypothetical protein